VIDDESLVKTRTNICLSYASAVSSYSVPEVNARCIYVIFTSSLRSRRLF
jgi:hypothetical protein